MLNIKFFVIIGSIVGASIVSSVDAKLLSSLFSKGSSGCAPSANLFQLPRLPSLSSLLCPRPYASYMGMSGYGGSYPSYGSGMYNMYPVSGKSICATPSAGGSTYATYPSYGASQSTYGSGLSNSWSYSSPSTYYNAGGSWRNDQRKGREFPSKQNLSPASQQPITQQLETSSDYSSSNFGTSRYSSFGGKLTTNPSKFVSTSAPRTHNSDQVISQQLISY